MAQLQLSLLGCTAEIARGCGIEMALVSCQPEQHVMSAPSDPSSMKPLLLGKPSEKGQRLKDPTGAAREPGDFMVTQECLAGRKTFIHPS